MCEKTKTKSRTNPNSNQTQYVVNICQHNKIYARMPFSKKKEHYLSLICVVHLDKSIFFIRRFFLNFLGCTADGATSDIVRYSDDNSVKGH